MFTLENNTFKFVFENEIGDVAGEQRRVYTLDVWQDGEWIAHTSFETFEAWGLANALTNNFLDNLLDEVEQRERCDTKVFSPKAGGLWVACGQDVYCPRCENRIQRRRLG